MYICVSQSLDAPRDRRVTPYVYTGVYDYCTHVFIFACMYITYTHFPMHLHVPTRANVCNAYIYVKANVQICTCIYSYIHICMYIWNTVCIFAKKTLHKSAREKQMQGIVYGCVHWYIYVCKRSACVYKTCAYTHIHVCIYLYTYTCIIKEYVCAYTMTCAFTYLHVCTRNKIKK